MDLVPFELQDCCDTALRNLSIGTRLQHGGITTSGLRNVLDAITHCVKDEAKKLRIYFELDDVLVNERLGAWQKRVEALQSRGETAREETPSESSAEPEQVGDEKDTVNALASFIFDLSEKGFNSERICKKLEFEEYKTPQNKRCKWRHLSWFAAYNSTRFRNSVRKYISTACSRERKRRQTG